MLATAKPNNQEASIFLHENGTIEEILAETPGKKLRWGQSLSR